MAMAPDVRSLIPLAESNICRLCGEDRPENAPIFTINDGGGCLSDVINCYLPIKIADDGKLPRNICFECESHLQGTISFFDLMVEGQKKLRSLLESEVALLNKVGTLENSPTNCFPYIEGLKINAEFFPITHPMFMKVEGRDKPRRKKGRPRKVCRPPVEVVLQEETVKPPSDDEDPLTGKKKRKRKAPSWYNEAVQGKELDEVFKKVIYGDDETSVVESDGEPIGRMKTGRGDELGVVVIANKVKSCNSRRVTILCCDKCNLTFSQESLFLKHMKTHSDLEIPSSFNKRLQQGGDENLEVTQIEPTEDTSISRGDTDSGNVSRNHICPLCQKPFKFSFSLINHLAVIHKDYKQEGGYLCDICGKRLEKPSSLLYHKKNEHRNGSTYVCNKCSKSFRSLQFLRRHQLVHSDLRPFSCPTCNTAFKTKTNLMNHQVTHTQEKRYFCHLCDQQFSHKTSLNLHIRWHTGLKPFKCEICDKTFSQKGNLQEHLRTHTGEKPFVCALCGRKFATSSQCKMHLKRHSGERPWKCEYCSKSFLIKDMWKCHLRRHLGENPFSCEICKRDFPEKWALRKHMRFHTGEKPYSCPVCFKTFSDCSNLAKHKKTHFKKYKEDDNVRASSVDNSDKEVMDEVPAELKQNDVHQIIYVTYQDPDDPNAKVSKKYFMGPGNELSALVQEEGVPETVGTSSALNDIGTVPESVQIPVQAALQFSTDVQQTDNTNPQGSQFIPVHLITTSGGKITAELMPIIPDPADVDDQPLSVEVLQQFNDNVDLVSLNGQTVQILETPVPPSPSSIWNNLFKAELFS